MARKVSKQSGGPLKCLDIEKWRVLTAEEMREYISRIGADPIQRSEPKKKGSILAVRTQLRPVDIYCYLKARFGPPNGIQEFLRRDDSDNWAHWDYVLNAHGESVYIMGTSREVHFMLSERLTDSDWPRLVKAIKADYGRLGKQKKATLQKLEKWVVFPNKYCAIANVCEDLHDTVSSEIAGYQDYLPSARSRSAFARTRRPLKKLGARAANLYGSCLQLSLLTPILAEAFINLLILVTCKRSIRDTPRQFDGFIRSHIDTKILDIPYKCVGFSRTINPNSDGYKNFKRIMDKRNHAIHGNIDPEREKIETVYFEGKRPLFETPGDHISNFMASLEKQHEPRVILKDYEDTHLFLLELVGCMELRLQEELWDVIADPYPGYDVNRKICGHLFPDYVSAGYPIGITYDDELKVDWH